jgi:AraC-like DNA-binding protein
MIVEFKNFEDATTSKIDLYAPEIVFVLAGQISLYMNNKTEVILNRGEFALIPVGLGLSYSTADDTTLMIVRLTGDIPECHVFRIDKILNDIKNVHNEIYALKVNRQMQYFINGLQSTIDDGLRCKIYLRTEISRMLFLLHAYYPYEEYVKFFSSIASMDMAFSGFVRLNHLKYHTVAEFARAMNMSAGQFAQRFHKVFGTTPGSWMQHEKAMVIYHDICQSDKPLKEIAYEHDLLYPNFIRYCKKNFGMSANAIRRTLLKGYYDR